MSSERTDLKRPSEWVQVEADHYNIRRYLSPQRMASIGHQIGLIGQYFPGGSVLAVGDGPGVCASLLRRMGHDVTVLDVDERLKPDVVASVTKIPDNLGPFDCFGCFQILEHLPWPEVLEALSELHRVSTQGGVISVPNRGPALSVSLMNRRFNGSRRLRLPAIGQPPMQNSKEHKWELRVNVREEEFRQALRESAFTIEKEVFPPQYLYHHFFVVRREP